MSTPNKKVACEEAAKAACDAIFNSGMTGPRSIDVGFNDDGSLFVSQPVTHEDGDNPFPIVTQENASEFVRAWDNYEEHQTMYMLQKCAEEAIQDPCVWCEKKPCVLKQEKDSLAEIAVYGQSTGADMKEIRFRMYRHVTQVIHGYLGRGERRRLPKCCEEGIKDMFSDEGEEHVGYKEAGEGNTQMEDEE